jgi:uncharacterized protein
MRKDIEFKAEEGTLLRGWHYLPDQRTGKVPTVVMAHGFASVKEMYLDKYAETGATPSVSSRPCPRPDTARIGTFGTGYEALTPK